MCNILIRLEGLNKSPGKGWERVKDTNLWVHEVEASVNYEANILLVIGRLKRRFETTKLYIHVSVSAENIVIPLRFASSFLEQLVLHDAILEIWCY